MQCWTSVWDRTSPLVRAGRVILKRAVHFLGLGVEFPDMPGAAATPAGFSTRRVHRARPASRTWPPPDWLLQDTLTTQISPWDRRDLAGCIGDVATRRRCFGFLSRLACMSPQGRIFAGLIARDAIMDLRDELDGKFSQITSNANAVGRNPASCVIDGSSFCMKMLN